MGDSLHTAIHTKDLTGHTYGAIVIGSGISGGWAVKKKETL